MPDTITGWKAVADSLLTEESCAFHRNLEISTHYAWIYTRLPACFKWAGMAAIASHHARLALFPLRLDSDRTGYVDIPRSLGRHKSLLIQDVNAIRETNNPSSTTSSGSTSRTCPPTTASTGYVLCCD